FCFNAFGRFAGKGFKCFFVHCYLSLAISGSYDKQLHSFIYSLDFY
ncbi:MAG: hypothetical protein ACI8SR_002322, partial [Oceanicoccus sp.]